MKIDDEHPDDLGLEHWTIPGGKYARTKLKNWNERLSELGSLFPELGKLAVEQGLSVDATRPNIEFYRSLDELHLLVPVK